MVLVDASYLKYYTANSREYKELIIENPVYFVHAFLKKLEYIKDRFQVSAKNKLVICNDSRMDIGEHQNYWRDIVRQKNNDILYRKKDGDKWRPKYYKEGRKHSDDVIDWKVIHKYYNQMLDKLKKYSDFYVIESKGIEADDIIAVLVQKSKNKPIVITNDKDLVNQLDCPMYALTDMETPKEKDDFEYKLLEFYSSGDTSDGIFGISPRYRWKSNLIKYNGDLNIIFGLLEEDKEKLNKKYGIEKYEDIFKLNDDKIINKIQAKWYVKERFEFNKKIMDLSLDNLPNKIINNILKDFKEQKCSFNQLEIKKYLEEIGIEECTDGVKGFLDKLNFFRYQTYTNTRFQHKKKDINDAIVKEFIDNF